MSLLSAVRGSSPRLGLRSLVKATVDEGTAGAALSAASGTFADTARSAAGSPVHSPMHRARTLSNARPAIGSAAAALPPNGHSPVLRAAAGLPFHSPSSRSRDLLVRSASPFGSSSSFVLPPAGEPLCRDAFPAHSPAPLRYSGGLHSRAWRSSDFGPYAIGLGSMLPPPTAASQSQSSDSSLAAAASPAMPAPATGEELITHVNSFQLPSASSPFCGAARSPAVLSASHYQQPQQQHLAPFASPPTGGWQRRQSFSSSLAAAVGASQSPLSSYSSFLQPAGSMGSPLVQRRRMSLSSTSTAGSPLLLARKGLGGSGQAALLATPPAFWGPSRLSLISLWLNRVV